MSLLIRMIVGIVIGAIGMTLAMTSRIARDGLHSISFSNSAAFAQEENEPEAAPAAPAAVPAPYYNSPATQPAPYYNSPAAQPAPYPDSNAGSAMQYQQEQARRQEEMLEQAERYRLQQEQYQRMINSQRQDY